MALFDWFTDSVSGLKEKWDSALYDFANKQTQLLKAEDDLLLVQDEAQGDTELWRQWLDAWNGLESALEQARSIETAITRVTGWYEYAVQNTSDFFSRTFSSEYEEGTMSGLGAFQAAGVLAVVATIAGWIAIASAAMVAAYSVIKAVDAKFSPTAIQQRKEARETYRESLQDSGFADGDAEMIEAEVNRKYPEILAPASTQTGLSDKITNWMILGIVGLGIWAWGKGR